MTEPDPLLEEQIRAAIRFSKQKGRALRKARQDRATCPTANPGASERDAVTVEAIRLLNASPTVLFAWKATVGKLRGANGKPYSVAPAGLGDILFVMRDRVMFGSIEVKRPNSDARVSQAQLDMAHKLRMAGYITGTITRPEQAIELVEAARR